MGDEKDDRLVAIQSELEAILDQRLSALATTLRATESTTRKIVGTELEIERHHATRSKLESEFAGLDKLLEGARAEADAIRIQHANLLAERDELNSEAERLQSEVADTRMAVDQTRNRVEQLEAEAEELRTENSALKTKLKTLEENISRMRRLKEELMSSISGLTAQMTGLAGSNK